MDVSVVITVLNEEGAVDELHSRLVGALDGPLPGHLKAENVRDVAGQGAVAAGRCDGRDEAGDARAGQRGRLDAR